MHAFGYYNGSWSVEEADSLVNMRDNLGMTYTQISWSLNRSPESVGRKYRHLQEAKRLKEMQDRINELKQAVEYHAYPVRYATGMAEGQEIAEKRGFLARLFGGRR